jgi:hypothetical protein
VKYKRIPIDLFGDSELQEAISVIDAKDCTVSKLRSSPLYNLQFTNCPFVAK